ncbi:LysR family transcriptional regulator [Aeromonas fluvialis]|uniref:LysR family transcriptional regulator n=1 Tax=Aeromonas fluvialis TaxID=591962 RepID=UPI001FCBD8CA|nr:LysR family transcriptional regulator [Aeromonas fluvialis]
MNIARLKNFTEIVKNNFNISATAEKLYTSQPTLSKQIKMLEDELGLALFIRKGKNLVGLTRAGEQVMELAKGVVAQVEQINQLSLGEQLATSSRWGSNWPPAGCCASPLPTLRRDTSYLR